MIKCGHILHGDERGTSLTEFVITMPIFVVILSFVYYMGAAGHVLSEETGEAQRLLWDRVVEQTQPPEGMIQYTDPDQPHVHPVPGAELDDQFMRTYELSQGRNILRAEIRAHEEGGHGALASGGHWGESHWRTRPAAEAIDIADEGKGPTDNPTDVLGDSDYAHTLIDDSSGDVVHMGAGGTGDLADMASTGTSRESVAPALGAGIRYGVVHGLREGELEFPRGWTLPVRFHYDVLVPPRPMVDGERESAALARTRLAGPYEELLGIQTTQALSFPPAASAPAWPED